MIFITNYKTKKILNPSKQAFDLPSLSISSQFPAILHWLFKSIIPVRGNHFYATFSSQVYFTKTPDSVQSWKRRWQVLLGGYRWGKSAQGTPVRKIQRMPFKTTLVFWGGRPDLPGRAFGFGIDSTIFCHCSFVRSIDFKPVNKTT